METPSYMQLLAPKEILNSFKFVDVKECTKYFELIFEEKVEQIPEALKGQDVVLDGFCNPLSLLSFPQKGRPTYLVLKRRRWKQKGGGAHYSNDYYFNHTGGQGNERICCFFKRST